MKWYPYQEYRYGSNKLNFIDFIIRGILLEEEELEYTHILKRELNEQNPDNWRICAKLAEYLVSPREIVRIDDIVANRRAMTNVIFDKILANEDIINWLNGSNPLVIEFHNVYRLYRTYDINPQTNLDDATRTTTICSYLDTSIIHKGIILEDDNTVPVHKITIQPPLPRDHAFYRKSLFDILKLYRKNIRRRYLYSYGSQAVTPGYINITHPYDDCKCRYGHLGLFMLDNCLEGIEANYSLGNFIAWVLYNRDKLIFINQELEISKKNLNEQEIRTKNPNLFINGVLNNYFETPFNIFYEDPYGYGLDMAAGIRFRQSLLGSHSGFTDVTNPDYMTQALDGYLKFMIYNAIGFAHTPVKEYVNINIMASAFRRKHFRTKKVKGQEDFDSYLDVIKALASGFVSAVKVADTIDKMHAGDMSNLDLLKYMMETSERYATETDMENIRSESNRKNFRYCIQLH